MENQALSAAPSDELRGHDRSPHWRGWITPLALLLIACLLYALRPSLGPVGHKVIGNRLPEVRLEGLTGSDRSIRSEDLAGSVVLMNFWGTWCGPCRIELPHLAGLGKKLSSREDFKFLAVSVGRAESADELAALRQATTEFIEQFGLDIPTYADPDDATFDGFCELLRSLEPSAMEGVPTTIVLDREGIIRGVWIGYAPGVEDQVEETVSQLLDGDGG